MNLFKILYGGRFMKNRRLISIVIASFLLLTALVAMTTYSITATKYGKLETKVAVALKYTEVFNTNRISKDSIPQLRSYTNLNLSRWSTGPSSIPFPNIKNTAIKSDSVEIPVRIYTPNNKNNLPIVIYSHGGGWIGGSIDTHDAVCRKLSSRSGCIVISVGYRLAPENPFPAALDDVYNVVLWAYKNADTIGGSKEFIVLAGDSAGGNLSAAAAMLDRDKKGSHVNCQVLIYPATDIYNINNKPWTYVPNLTLSKEDIEKYVSLYVPKKEDRKNPYVSPLLADNFTGLPPALIITAEIDPLRNEGESYGYKLRESGCSVIISRYKGVPHGFLNMDTLTTKCDEAINEMCAYLQKQFNNKR